MSYCRFSSDDYQCDLYCYESDEGYVIHVAANRIQGRVPALPDPLPPGDAEESFSAFLDAMRRQSRYVRSAKRVKIGGAFDGATFVERSPEAFLGRLFSLREHGYRFPDRVIRLAEGEIRNRAAGSGCSVTEGESGDCPVEPANPGLSG